MRVSIKNNLATAIIDTKGAELKSYIDNTGKDYIWCGDPVHWKGTSPLLFPMIGNLREGKTIIDGQEYSIPKHGFVRDKEFQILSMKENQAVFSYSFTEETLTMYPFRFNLRLTYTLIGTELTLTYDVYNLDTKEMYYHIGAHPAFNCPMCEGEEFSDYILQFEKNETCMSPVFDLDNHHLDNNNRLCHLNNTNTLTLDYSMFNNDAIVFDDMKSRKVSLINRNTKKGILVDYNSFDMIAFWTPMNDTAPFLCIEPWNGSAIFNDEDNEFAHKRFIQTVQPGEIKTYQLKIDII